MFERFTDRARRVVVHAQREARSLDHDHIGVEHLLLGLLGEAEGSAARALGELGIDLEACRAGVEKLVGRGAEPAEGDHIPFTPGAKKALELSLREALGLGHSFIGTGHLLLGLIREGAGVAAQVLFASGTELEAVRAKVVEILSEPGELTEEVTDEPSEPGTVTGSVEDVVVMLQSLQEENHRLQMEIERLRELVLRLGGEPDPPVA